MFSYLIITFENLFTFEKYKLFDMNVIKILFKNISARRLYNFPGQDKQFKTYHNASSENIIFTIEKPETLVLKIDFSEAWITMTSCYSFTNLKLFSLLALDAIFPDFLFIPIIILLILFAEDGRQKQTVITLPRVPVRTFVVGMENGSQCTGCIETEISATQVPPKMQL